MRSIWLIMVMLESIEMNNAFGGDVNVNLNFKELLNIILNCLIENNYIL